MRREEIHCSICCCFGWWIVDRGSDAVALLKLISGITAFAGAVSVDLSAERIVGLAGVVCKMKVREAALA